MPQFRAPTRKKRCTLILPSPSYLLLGSNGRPALHCTALNDHTATGACSVANPEPLALHLPHRAHPFRACTARPRLPNVPSSPAPGRTRAIGTRLTPFNPLIQRAEILGDDGCSRKRGHESTALDSDVLDTWSESSSAGSMSPPHYSMTQHDDVFQSITLLHPVGTTAPHPKRSRSASFEAILSDLPDSTSPVLTGFTSEGHPHLVLASPDDTSADAAAVAGTRDIVFPGSAGSSRLHTPSQSPTTVVQPAVAAPRSSGGNLVESSEKPNFLKPLSTAERRRLRSAGRGAAIIRVNSDLSFA